jgi:alkylation response protein AidB-like acyl-CoA dehydrogenase
VTRKLSIVFVRFHYCATSKRIFCFYLCIIAQTDIEKGHKGINAFIVEKGWAGFDIGPKERK